MSIDLTEFNKVEDYLKKRNFSYVRKDKTYEINWETHQLTVHNEGIYEWDVICSHGSYGWEDGLLEIAGCILPDSCEDSVEGDLTAKDVIERIEAVYGED